MSRRPARLAGVLLGGALLLGASAAAAQQSGAIGDSNWRQTSRPTRRDAYASSQHFAFELRFGPYSPEVDEEFGAGFGDDPTAPYAKTFGEPNEDGQWETDPQFYFGLEFDWQAARIPYVGVIGPGFGWGFTTVSAVAKTYPKLEPSGTDTSLTIMPMHLSAVLRGDELMRRTGVPLVPYGKFGLGFATWSASTTSGDSSVPDPENSMETVAGSGVTWGIHMALGAMLALNWLDGRSAATLDETTSVNHIYVFGEWMNASLDGLGSRPQMHVGTSTWVLGLTADF